MAETKRFVQNQCPTGASRRRSAARKISVVKLLLLKIHLLFLPKCRVSTLRLGVCNFMYGGILGYAFVPGGKQKSYQWQQKGLR